MRFYLFENLGERVTTFFFGLIIFIICPVFFCLQNIFLGMCLFENSHKNWAHALRHVVRSMKRQLVVLYDITLFNENSNMDKYHSWFGIGRLLLGYTFYVLPLFGFGILSMCGQLQVTLCRPLNATFLVDNEVVPFVNMSNLYESRQLLAKEKIGWNDILDGEGGLVWDYGNQGYRRHQYWSFDNITDLIKQYNYIGYHDVCIYPRSKFDLPHASNSDQLTSKGLDRVSSGYAVKNNSGAD